MEQSIKMDWKKHLSVINEGDMVRLIKYHPTCNSTSCCDIHYIIGNTYEVTGISNNLNNYVISHRCSFPKECLQKVYEVKLK